MPVEFSYIYCVKGKRLCKAALINLKQKMDSNLTGTIFI